MNENSDYQPGGRPLTGRSVLMMLLAFFGIMLLANFIMARQAVKTFSGLDADNPYDSGLAYNKEVAAAKVQAALAWSVDLTQTAGSGATQLTATVKDKEGQPVSGLDVTMRFIYPSTRKFDREVAAVAVADGVYSGSAELIGGKWDVEVDLKRNGERQFRSRNAIIIE
jgi:nitrogen fixation protein FixH